MPVIYSVSEINRNKFSNRCAGIAMKLQFSDYDGPTGLFVATGKEILPLTGAAGATAFVGAGMQSGTIDPEQSQQIQAAVDGALDAGDAGAAHPGI